MPKILTNNAFIEKAIFIHGNKYGYEKVNYKTALKKVYIRCPTHGYFLQRPNDHLNGKGCKKCATEEVNKKKLEKKSIEFLQLAKEKFGDLFDYSFVKYRGQKKPVKIICKEHGGFMQSPMVHIRSKYGCPKCSLKYKSEHRLLPNKEALSRLIAKHNGRYEYPNFKYTGSSGYINILCKKHGLFRQMYVNHASGKGCKKCFFEKISEQRSDTISTFIEKANKKHNYAYSYNESFYKDSQTKISIFCQKHGEFKKTPNKHLLGSGCPKCLSKAKGSKAEDEIAKFISDLGFDVKRHVSLFSDKREVDIYIEEKKLAIEYNGVYWHSLKDKYYHQKKTKDLYQKGIRLIHIFEDHFQEKKDIVLGIIRLALGKPEKIYYARKLKIDDTISAKEARAFLLNNHIYEFRGADKHLALRDTNGEIVSYMSFGLNKFSKKKNKPWELIRFANKNGCSVVGGAEKLHKHFVKLYNPLEIVCYADASLFTGALYKKLGYRLVGLTPPNNWYILKKRRKHRMSFTKIKLQNNFNIDISKYKNSTAHEIMTELGFFSIWDSGSWKLIFRQKVDFV